MVHVRACVVLLPQRSDALDADGPECATHLDEKTGDWDPVRALARADVADRAIDGETPVIVFLAHSGPDHLAGVAIGDRGCILLPLVARPGLDGNRLEHLAFLPSSWLQPLTLVNHLSSGE